MVQGEGKAPEIEGMMHDASDEVLRERAERETCASGESLSRPQGTTRSALKMLPSAPRQVGLPTCIAVFVLWNAVNG